MAIVCSGISSSLRVRAEFVATLTSSRELVESQVGVDNVEVVLVEFRPVTSQDGGCGKECLVSN